VPVGKLEMKMKVRKNSVLWLQYITTNHYISFMPCVAANNIFMILLDAYSSSRFHHSLEQHS